jgi:hypothetical protein
MLATYCWSMVKLDNNAVFRLMCPQEEEEEEQQAKLRPALHVVSTPRGKKVLLCCVKWLTFFARKLFKLKGLCGTFKVCNLMDEWGNETFSFAVAIAK